jgi:hypothetical protein
MASVGATAVTTPKDPQTGQFVSVVSGAPRIGSAGFTALTGTGTHEVSPESVPPVSGQPDSLLTYAPEADQVAFKVGYQMPAGTPGPSYRT